MHPDFNLIASLVCAALGDIKGADYLSRSWPMTEAEATDMRQLADSAATKLRAALVALGSIAYSERILHNIATFSPCTCSGRVHDQDSGTCAVAMAERALKKESGGGDPAEGELR